MEGKSSYPAAMGYLDHRYPRDDIENRRPSRRPVSKWWLIGGFSLCVVDSAIAKLTEQPFDGSKIAAGQFQWPAGCSERQYRPGDQLSRACFDRFQKISPKWARAHRMKVRQTRKSSHYSYYRLGDDAVEKFCIAWEDHCRVGNVYQALFITDPRISDPRSSGWRTIAWSS